MRFSLAFAALAASVVLASSTAHAAPDAAEPTASTCTAYIDALPYTIDAPGTYCLRRDQVSAYYGQAILVMSSDVTVDCRNRRISLAPGQYAGGTTGVGLDMGLGNVKVQNCQLSGFDIGVWMPFNGANNAVRNNRIDRFTSSGIQAGGDNFEAANNRITYGGGMYNGSTGISLSGDMAVGGANGQALTNNLIAGLYGPTAAGIMAIGSNGLRVINNHVMGVRGNANGPASGMTFNLTPDLQLINNSISAMSQDQVFTPMQSQTPPALCRGNTIYNSIQMPFYGCLRTFDNTTVQTPIY